MIGTLVFLFLCAPIAVLGGVVILFLTFPIIVDTLGMALESWRDMLNGR